MPWAVFVKLIQFCVEAVARIAVLKFSGCALLDVLEKITCVAEDSSRN